MECRDIRFNQFGSIDCEINHPEHGWIPFTASPDDPENFGKRLYQELVIKNPEPYTEPITDDSEKWEYIRTERNRLIATTDWAALPDSPAYSQELLDYRQALRDLPQTYASPGDVVWPINPLEGDSE